MDSLDEMTATHAELAEWTGLSARGDAEAGKRGMMVKAALKPYRVVKVIGDKYAGEWPREVFRSHGVTYEANAKPKNDLYIALLPLLSSQMIELVDAPRMISQIASA